MGSYAPLAGLGLDVDALLRQRRLAQTAPEPEPPAPSITAQPSLLDQRLMERPPVAGSPLPNVRVPSAVESQFQAASPQPILDAAQHAETGIGLTSPDRNVRNQSGHEAYGAYAPYLMPGPQADQLKDIEAAGPPQKKGFLAHLAGIGKGFIMGGPVGAVAGGISPNLIERAAYNTYTHPMAQQRAAFEQQQQSQGLNRAQDYTQATGMTLNNELSEPAKMRELQAQSLLQQREYMQRLGAGRLDATNRGLDIREDTANSNAAYKAARLEQFNRGITNNQYIKTVGADGNTYLVNKQDPTDAAMVTADGRPIGDWGTSLELGRNYRAAEAQKGAMERTQVTQSGANQRAAEVQAGADRRQGVSQAGMDRRVKGKTKGFLDTMKEKMGGGAQSDAQAALKAEYQRRKAANPAKGEAMRQKIQHDYGFDPEQ